MHISAWEEALDETVAEPRWQAKAQPISYLPPASLSLHVKALRVLSSTQIENVTSTLKVRSSNWQKRHRNNTSCRDLKSGLSIRKTVPILYFCLVSQPLLLHSPAGFKGCLDLTYCLDPKSALKNWAEKANWHLAINWSSRMHRTPLDHF